MPGASFQTRFARPFGLVQVAFALAFPIASAAGPLDDSECIVPAKAGGGFDVTCKFAKTLLENTKAIRSPMRITYLPGGIGALAYNVIISKRPADANVVVAFSGGSLLNLAQGRFGRYSERDVRWIASLGADHGALVVSADSTIRSLDDLKRMLRQDPFKVVFGGAGTVGSQDWMKAAMTARALGIDFKSIRFVGFEGGGEAIRAIRGRHLDVLTGDVAEAQQEIDAGAPLRIIAVLADKRLPGKLANLPTAKEQGYDIRWEIIRGVYVGPKVTDSDYETWVNAFRKAVTFPGFKELSEKHYLVPFALTGAELDSHIAQSMASYRKLAEQFGLRTTQR